MIISNIFQVFTDNAILHLYLELSDRGGFSTHEHRNQILVRFIKKSLKNQKYKIIRKELKRLLHVRGNTSISLESRLWDFKIVSDKSKSDLRHLYDLLEYLNLDLGLESRFFIDEPDEKFISMKQYEVENCFNKKGEQLTPISMTIETAKLDKVIDYISQKSPFTVEIASSSSKCFFIVIYLFLNNK
ncbi:DUF2913 family protein [Shewanella woodyi]|uniref:DUF2913 family protein n=1 Tax=Shewanella woodyi (strain ATCC 51908 / MS32) TaxID=392500 RepID=B1KQ56_SHEWM|nr:DUF2913 family protein [Shewanella woodyi]ACA89169.1 conserved hypothetical protein [Shewanella woodyi ATCC 51908]